jgi:hypothetical protein
MKISFGAVDALVLASAFLQTASPTAGAALYSSSNAANTRVWPAAQGEQNYDRERWEHCERLRDREHNLRDRLAYAPPYGEDRARLEHRLREVHYQREQCRGRCELLAPVYGQFTEGFETTDLKAAKPLVDYLRRL